MLRFRLQIIGLFLGGVFPLLGQAQNYRPTDQIEVQDLSNRLRPLHQSAYEFERDFDANDDLFFTKPNPKAYRKKKVKTISIYNSSAILIYSCELDRAGKIVRKTTKGQKYYITDYKTEINPSYVIYNKHYSQDSILKRLDSTLTIVHQYANTDTLLTFHEQRMITYMQGALINQKNGYLNGRYQNKKESKQSNPFQVEMVVKKKRRKKYFKKAFKTDYDSLTFYAYNQVSYYSSAYHQKNGFEIPWDSIAKHSFFELYNKEIVKDCPIQGSCFSEPSHLVETMWCGHSDYNRQHAQDGYSYFYTRLKNGLYETYNSNYYPVDPNPPPVVKDTSSTYDGEITIIRIDNGGPPRLSTPIKSIRYRYEYTYYQ